MCAWSPILPLSANLLWKLDIGVLRMLFIASVYFQVISQYGDVRLIASFYQFCNGIQLNRVLPPGPREYWAELAAEHKKAPSHQEWMYEADPFAARKSVEDRQEKVAKKREETQQANTHTVPQTQRDPFDNSPEIKLSTELRELVENAIKTVVIFTYYDPYRCAHP